MHIFPHVVKGDQIRLNYFKGRKIKGDKKVFPMFIYFQTAYSLQSNDEQYAVAITSSQYNLSTKFILKYLSLTEPFPLFPYSK